MTDFPKFFEVSARWMTACGLGFEPRVYRVLKVEDLGEHAAEWCRTMVTVDRDGYEWVVAIGRGRFTNDQIL